HQRDHARHVAALDRGAQAGVDGLAAGDVLRPRRAACGREHDTGDDKSGLPIHASLPADAWPCGTSRACRYDETNTGNTACPMARARARNATRDANGPRPRQTWAAAIGKEPWKQSNPL